MKNSRISKCFHATLIVSSLIFLIAGCTSISEPAAPRGGVANETQAAKNDKTSATIPVIQYDDEGDRDAAHELATAEHYKLVQTDSPDDLGDSTEWIIVGGQNANTLYKTYFEDITVADNGFIRVMKSEVMYEGAKRQIWGVAGWNQYDTIMSVRWIIDNGLPSVSKKQAWVVVQYCDEADRTTAINLSNTFGWPLINTCSPSELSKYQGWVLIGGQNANSIFKQIFGEALSKHDHGYVSIQVNDSYLFNGEERIAWGIAGWDLSDTVASARFVIDNGLPQDNVKRK
ncbi:hypothetical protein ES703_75916 [subsurface metagenome]